MGMDWLKGEWVGWRGRVAVMVGLSGAAEDDCCVVLCCDVCCVVVD